MALLLSIAFVLAATQPVTEAKMRAEVETLEARGRKAQELRPRSPQRYVTESLALADAYAQLARRYAAFRPSQGAALAGVTHTMRAADAARYDLEDPRKAIEIYRRGAALQEQSHPGSGKLAFHEVIADIQQFDLGDRAAAASSLEELRKASATLLEPRGELAAWHLWKAKWLDAEIAYLRTGKRFDGPIDATLVAGIFPQLYFGSGQATVAAGIVDPQLNPYSPVTISPAEVEQKLAALPPSHNMFLRTWIFAAYLPTAAAARQWLGRNDPGGFWTASLLTFVAVFDRDPARLADAEVVTSLVRTQSGKPTGFALLSREYAKTHPIPKLNMKFGH